MHTGREESAREAMEILGEICTIHSHIPEINRKWTVHSKIEMRICKPKTMEIFSQKLLRNYGTSPWYTLSIPGIPRNSKTLSAKNYD